ncbi:lymphocyte cytosolic protein 2a isoform X2 [Gouania willdenowi]|uniref:Lymphocyte cytosolic protein 2-like n=1 Tax=Gouania willdenowi TaxID=441366 RepID=A0A8C5G472_GOUWI|nr:lymphocyte cytosolic protein 2-like isoform X2 [Gouania willdenowi]
MSSMRTPCRADVMTWSPQQLSDYLNTLHLSGCDKAVLRNSISGSRFVNLSENDLQKFPRIHIPMISKISSEINKKEKKGLFKKKLPPRFHQPETHVAEGWGDDEFDDDDDYESPRSDDEDGSDVQDYEDPDDADLSSEYEPPPTEQTEETKLCPTLPLAEGDYIDKRATPPALSPRPLTRPQPGVFGRDSSPHRGKPSANFPPGPPQILRHTKPGRAVGSSNLSPVRAKPVVVPPPSASISRSNSSARPTANANRDDMWTEQTHDEAIKHKSFPLHNKSLPPRPGIARHGDSAPPVGHSVRSLPHKLPSEMNEYRGMKSDTQFTHLPPPKTANSEDLDPRWYVGAVTRGRAEQCLKRLQKDGAYLVRNSTRQLNNQPFTLMVFYHNKVYNIQIRHEQQHFLLGTGKVQERFQSVGDMIRNYSQAPLVLIDAKGQSFGQQNQCMLSEPVAGHMTADV